QRPRDRALERVGGPHLHVLVAHVALVNQRADSIVANLTFDGFDRLLSLDPSVEYAVDNSAHRSCPPRTTLDSYLIDHKREGCRLRHVRDVMDAWAGARAWADLVHAPGFEHPRSRRVLRGSDQFNSRRHKGRNR